MTTAGSKLTIESGDFVGFLSRSENVTAEVVVIFVTDSGEEEVIVVGQSGNVILGEADILAKRIQDYVDFVLKFLEPFAPKKVTFLGHSFGGRVIIKMASRDLPFEIEKVILVDSAGVKPKKTAAQKIRQRNYKIGRKILETAPVKALFPDALEEFRRSHGSADYNSATPVMRQTLVNTVNEDLVEYMPNMKMPVLLVWGENDDATPLSDAKLMEQLMPDAGLVTLKNCGHYSFLEQQFTFNKVLASFMEID